MSEAGEKKKVAIVVPTYKSDISADEQISLKHLLHFLGKHDIFYAAPKGLEVNYHKFPFVYFDPKYFSDQLAYSRLLTSKIFFDSFKDYEFILIYQLDCLVFSDELEQWVEKKYDYIGAPWLSGHNVSGYSSVDAVGNGGFSLRSVPAALQTLESMAKPGKGLARILGATGKFGQAASLKEWLKQIRHEWRFSPYSRYVTYEDYFWSFEAKKLYPEFYIAAPTQALKFAFEDQPRYCYEQNQKQLPFGCHAWNKWDRGFWQPFLLK